MRKVFEIDRLADCVESRFGVKCFRGESSVGFNECVASFLLDVGLPPLAGGVVVVNAVSVVVGFDLLNGDDVAAVHGSGRVEQVFADPEGGGVLVRFGYDWVDLVKALDCYDRSNVVNIFDRKVREVF